MKTSITSKKKKINKITFRDVDHGAGRLGVGWSAGIVARIHVSHVTYRQLASDTSICCTFTLLAVVRHWIAFYLSDDLDSRTSPGFCPAAGRWTATRIVHRCFGTAAVSDRVIIDHPVIMIPKDKLWLLRNLNDCWKQKTKRIGANEQRCHGHLSLGFFCFLFFSLHFWWCKSTG